MIELMRDAIIKTHLPIIIIEIVELSANGTLLKSFIEICEKRTKNDYKLIELIMIETILKIIVNGQLENKIVGIEEIQYMYEIYLFLNIVRSII